MRKHWRALLAALAVLLAFFAIFQLRAPYYFLQDDNRTFSLPAFSYAYETLAGHGRFALYNFHQLLGVPVFQETPVFYPFVYVSVFLSKLFFGHGRYHLVRCIPVKHSHLFQPLEAGRARFSEPHMS